MKRDSGSFRDPSGYVFHDRGRIFRTIAPCYKEDWEYVNSSGLLRKILDSGHIPGFHEVEAQEAAALLGQAGSRQTETRQAEAGQAEFARTGQDQSGPAQSGPHSSEVWKLLAVETLPFISYPYEWSFSQLKDAALLTLELQRLALEHGCILKDASAYNVQFYKGKPVFIDMLSFERWQDGQPWQAYGQFCTHFLGPLALMAKADLRLGLLSRQWIDGIPLDLACKLLPVKAKFSPGLFLHIFLHSHMRDKHADGREAVKKVTEAKLSLPKMLDVVDSLRGAVEKLKLPGQKTEWAEYYSDTNYSPAARESKENIVRAAAERHARRQAESQSESLAGNRSGGLALDLGANTGYFSRVIEPFFASVLSTDYDPLAVENNYKNNSSPSLYPYILDISNPSSGGGWAEQERKSFSERCRADFIMALALIHHLFFTFRIPFSLAAEYLSELLKDGGVAVVEFVPKEDSQVQRLLAVRDDIFPMYTEADFVAAFTESLFTLEAQEKIEDSGRTLFTFRKTPC